MKMFLPFSNDSKSWEPHAITLRKIPDVTSGSRLDPWKLARHVGLTVADREFVLHMLRDSNHDQLLSKDKFVWSGGSFPEPLPDGSRLCILNPMHSLRRNKATLMEEIVHVYRNHKPTRVGIIADILESREYHADQEKEAYGIGAAALIPWSSFFPLLNSGKTVQELAEHFEVTTKLIEYRIKITGGYRIYRARQQLLKSAVKLSSPPSPSTHL